MKKAITNDSFKRRQRAYKIVDKEYNDAVDRGGKEGLYVANLVEDVVTAYAQGYDIKVSKKGQKPVLLKKAILLDRV